MCLYVCGISLWRPNNRRLFFLPSWSDVPSWPLVPGRHHRSPSPIRRRHRFHRLLHCCQSYPVHRITVCVCVCRSKGSCVSKVPNKTIIPKNCLVFFWKFSANSPWKNYHPDPVFICSCCFFRLKNNFFYDIRQRKFSAEHGWVYYLSAQCLRNEVKWTAVAINARSCRTSMWPPRRHWRWRD